MFTDFFKLKKYLCLLLLTVLLGIAGDYPATQPNLQFAARPNPLNIGNCYQYKNCLGESIGNMWFHSPEFCKPNGGKSWKNREGRCFNLPDGPQPLNPRDFV
ncbi:MAG: hypothetical protein LBF22_04380 [Deltaproteobacteria bacterium]|jgi:hypothetical protein|nr:hypothetical protein [Deltaproteobacteria bacterium]